LSLTLREARPSDAELLWRWANDPETRANSFSRAAISYADHVAWLERRLASDATRIWIFGDEGVPVRAWPHLPVRPNVPDRVRGSLRRFDLPQRESQLSAVRPTQSPFPNGALLGVDAREFRRERQLQRGSLRDWPGARAT